MRKGHWPEHQYPTGLPVKIAPRFVALLALSIILGPAYAQPYPSRAIRFVVPYPAGGTTDILSRLIGIKLSESWGQPVIIDNRPGAASIIGSEIVATSSPDGHTIGMFLTPHAVNPFVMAKLPYDTLKDFSPVALVAVVPGLMVTNPTVAATNLSELIVLARSKPGQFNYASPGPLTSGHLSMELLKSMAGVNITHIPYKGGAAALAATIGNQVQFLISGPPNVLPHIKTRRLRAIALTTAQRLAELPEIPTIAEQGFPGYDTYEWYGIFAPGKTPRSTVEKLNVEVNRIIDLPDIHARMQEQGALQRKTSPEEFSRFVRNEMDKWGNLAKKIGLKPD